MNIQLTKLYDSRNLGEFTKGSPQSVKAGLEYLVDHAIHAEDAEPAYGQDNYYDLMYDCAINFAVTRCEGEYDISLNDLLGRTVY